MVFARVPRLGAVKRRLARDIGARAALHFHRSTLIGLVRALTGDRRFRTVLALTPDGAKCRLPLRVARIGQGAGDLGKRCGACARFSRGRVAIIGSDIPDATADDVAHAFGALGRADAVRPCSGWWLLVGGAVVNGGRRGRFAVRWSTGACVG